MSISGRRELSLLPVLLSLASGPAVAEGILPFAVSGDAIEQPLGGLAGEPAAGRRTVLDRETGNCLICHRGDDPAEPFQGDIGPPLPGVGARLSPGQIRLRLVDASRLNAETVMPPYYRSEGLHEVAARYRGKPALSAQEIENVVAYLASLR